MISVHAIELSINRREWWRNVIGNMTWYKLKLSSWLMRQRACANFIMKVNILLMPYCHICLPFGMQILEPTKSFISNLFVKASNLSMSCRHTLAFLTYMLMMNLVKWLHYYKPLIVCLMRSQLIFSQIIMLKASFFLSNKMTRRMQHRLNTISNTNIQIPYELLLSCMYHITRNVCNWKLKRWESENYRVLHLQIKL